jgi:hypothetical protein
MLISYNNLSGTYKVLKLEMHRVLEFNQLSGELPPELGNLHQLEIM